MVCENVFSWIVWPSWYQARRSNLTKDGAIAATEAHLNLFFSHFMWKDKMYFEYSGLLASTNSQGFCNNVSSICDFPVRVCLNFPTSKCFHFRFLYPLLSTHLRRCLSTQKHLPGLLWIKNWNGLRTFPTARRIPGLFISIRKASTLPVWFSSPFWLFSCCFRRFSEEIL